MIFGRRGVGSREAVAIVEPLHDHDVTIAHGVGGHIGVEQLRSRLEHFAYDAGLVAETPQLERDLLQALELTGEMLEARRRVALAVEETGVVQGQRGKLADRLD